MLRRVEIRAFRSLNDVTVDISTPLVALVGRNGAGKTNFLKAIEWLARAATSLEAISTPFSFHGPEAPQSLEEVTIEAVLGSGQVRFTFARDGNLVAPEGETPTIVGSLRESFSISTDGATWVKVFERNGGSLEFAGRSAPVQLGELSPALPALAALLPPEHDLRPRVRELSDFLASIRYYPLEEPMASSRDDSHVVDSQELSQWRAQPQVGGDASVPLRLLHLYLDDRPRFEELHSLLGPNGLGILNNIDFSKYEVPRRPTSPKGEDRHIYFLDIEPAGCDGGWFAFSELSAGSRRIIRLLVSLIYDRSNVMLLEQPEDSIHYGLATKVLDLLSKYSEQRSVIMTTHSARVFNALPPESIRLVTMSHGATTVRALDANELRAARAFLENEGSMSDFLETVQGE